MWKFLEALLYDNTIEEEYYRKIRQKSSSKSAVIVGLVAAVGGFLYGYDTGLINDLLEMRYVYENFPENLHSFTSHERALITAVLSLGTFIGALIAPLISDNYGRKFSIIVSSGLIFNAGNILQIASTNVALLCVGRAISGVSVGILSAIVPLYQAEASFSQMGQRFRRFHISMGHYLGLVDSECRLSRHSKNDQFWLISDPRGPPVSLGSYLVHGDAFLARKSPLLCSKRRSSESSR